MAVDEGTRSVDDDEEDIPDWKKPAPLDMTGYASGDKIQAALDIEKAFKPAAPDSEDTVYDGLPIIEEATRFKEEGNLYVKRKNFNDAVKLYEKGIATLIKCKGQPMLPDESNKVDTLVAQIHGNLAQCMLSLQLYRKAIDAATDCLTVDKTNAKALHRRSLAYEHLREWSEALRDALALKKLGCGSIDPKQLETRCETLLEKMTAENKAVNEAGAANEDLFAMKERFEEVMDKYDLGDGSAAPLVVDWLVDNDGFPGNLQEAVAKMRKRWEMTKEDAEDFAKWIKKGIEMKVIPNPKAKARANPFSKHG